MAITAESVKSLVPRRGAPERPLGYAPRERPQLSYKGHLVTCLLGTWMLAGLYLDGWAHRNRDLQDSITTPWHAIFYAGYILFATWIIWVVLRRLRKGHRGLYAIPVGYGVGLLGVAIFMVGGTFDQVWHLSLGVEQDINAFQSPTHWLLAIGMFLMLSSPLRAGWSSAGTQNPKLKQFVPTLWSIVLTASMFFFAFNYMSFFIGDTPTVQAEEFREVLGAGVSDDLAFSINEQLRVLGLLMISLTSLGLVGFALFTLRRWRLPFGSLTAVFFLTANFDNAVWEYRFGWVVVAALVGGLAGDIYIRLFDPRPSNPTAWRAFPLAVLAPMWLTYYLIMKVVYEMNWPAEMWTGSIITSILMATLLAFAMVPFRNPVPGGDR